jgi:Protein of unknown function (DUF2924)
VAQADAKAFGGFDRETVRLLDRLARSEDPQAILASLRDRRLKPGTLLVREWDGEIHRVIVAGDGFVWREQTYSSLSEIARLITGTRWNGPRFFGLRVTKGADRNGAEKSHSGHSIAPRRGRPSKRLGVEAPPHMNRDNSAGTGR